MAGVPQSGGSGGPDKEDGLLDPKPASRMLWIVPSILLHVLVLVVWFNLPEEEAEEREDRKLVIKKEQAEQLQEFVEDSNLKELHGEVRRLQEVKRTMAALRTEAMLSLGEFEEEMRAAVDTDVGPVLAQLGAAQEKLIEGQLAVAGKLEKLEVLFDRMKPLIEAKEVSGLLGYGQQALELRKGLQPVLEASDRSFLLVRAKLEDADGVLGWAEDAALVRGWEAYMELQNRALQQQGASADRLGQRQISQMGALGRIVREGAHFSQQLEHAAAQEKKVTTDYESRKKLYTENRIKAQASEKVAEGKIEERKKRVVDLQKKRAELVTKRKQLKGNSAEIKQQRLALQKEVLGLEQQARVVTNERKAADNELRALKRQSNHWKMQFDRLKKPPARSAKDRQRMIDTMDRSLQLLVDGKADMAAQKEALASQKEALDQLNELAELILEGGKESR